MAAQLGIADAGGLRRQELVFAILRAEGRRQVDIHAEGVLEVLADGFGFLRAADANYLPGPDDVYVSPSQIRRFDLRTGDAVGGLIRAPKESERYFALLKVESVNGAAPTGQREGGFDQLTAVPPTRDLGLTVAGDAARALEGVTLCAGQRCAIVAPPGPEAPALIAAIAAAARALPDAACMTLVVDARPEDVTTARRELGGLVVATTLDEPAARHVQVAEIVIERAKRLAEAGRDVILTVDSLTRLARAYNSVVPPSPKLLAAELDPAAAHKTKRFFAAGRALEGAGTLTLVAALTVDPGSRFDTAVATELAGAANLELRA